MNTKSTDSNFTLASEWRHWKDNLRALDNVHLFGDSKLPFRKQHTPVSPHKRMKSARTVRIIIVILME